MDLADRLDNFILNDKNKFLLEDVMLNYENYLKLLNDSDLKILKGYIKALTHTEVRSNQNFDVKDYLFLEACENINKNSSSVHTMINIFKNNSDISNEDVITIHTNLMKGIDDSISCGFRDNDNKFVGSFNLDGTKRIDYIPVLSKNIVSDMNQVLEYLNHDNLDNPFIVPFVTHCLISIMQPFDDGNTRTARLLQHGKIWSNTNEIYNMNLENPVLYLSSVYYRYGFQYRELMTRVANEKDSDSWNEWIRFNLNLTNEQLNSYNDTLNKVRQY